jgi:hypothetical protein
MTKFDAKNADYGYGYGHGNSYSSHGYGYGSRYGGNNQALPGPVKQEHREQLLTSAREGVMEDAALRLALDLLRALACEIAAI